MTVRQFLLGDFSLESGEVLPNAVMGYRTWGRLSPEGDNAIVLPSYYSGSSASYEPWVQSGGMFDPADWFVIAYEQFGAGASTRPSSLDSPWPKISLRDSVRAAKCLVESQGITSVRLVAGWSMGGMQAFAWASLYPQCVKSAFALCATPACNPVNTVFLEGIRGILDHEDGRTFKQLQRYEAEARLSAFGKAYAGWAYSDAFFMSREYLQVGYSSLEDVLDGWAADHRAMDGDDLLAQLDVWRGERFAPISRSTTADLPPIVAMPCTTDRYFSPEAVCSQLSLVPGMNVVELESDLGHIAGRPGIRQKETEQIRAAVEQLLRQTS